MTVTVNVRMKQRRKTAANWTSANEVLLEGEMGVETDTRKFKFGDGVTAWNSLAYASSVVPTVVSAFTNDAGYTTAAAVAAAYQPLDSDLTAFAGKTAPSGAVVGTTDTQTLTNKTLTSPALTTPALGAATGTSLAVTGNITTSAGNVGVNTTGPSNNLHVHNASSAEQIGISDASDRSTIQQGGALYINSGVTGGSTQVIFRRGSGYDETARFDGSGNLRPGADNTQNFGSGALRWATIYAGTGTINTSDARAKRDFGTIPDDWLDAWGEVQWSRFRFKDGERWHTGLVAQEVCGAFARYGLDAREIGLICFDEWPARRAVRAKHDRKGKLIRAAEPGVTAGNRWGLRYDECQAIEAAWQRRELALLEARVAALEPERP